MINIIYKMIVKRQMKNINPVGIDDSTYTNELIKTRQEAIRNEKN